MTRQRAALIHKRNWREEESRYRVERVTAFYDRRTRLWIVQRLDRDGNQIAEADYAHTKEHADHLARRLLETDTLERILRGEPREDGGALALPTWSLKACTLRLT